MAEPDLTEDLPDAPAFKPALELPKMSEEDLRKFVLDFIAGQIFSDRHVRSPNDMGMVFMPLLLGALSGYEVSSLEQIGLIYEYVGQAGPSSINGMPCFFSFRMMHRDDWARASAAIDREQERQKTLLV